MPRKALVSREEAISVLEKYIDYFQTPELPSYSSKVWNEMSKEFNNKWNAHAVYTSVREDRRNILSTARLNKGIILTKTEPDYSRGEESDEPSEVVEDTIDFELLDDQKITNESLLDLSLTPLLWHKIKPPENEDCYEETPDTYEITTSTEWTDIIFRVFFLKYHFPCVYFFQKARVSNSLENRRYIQIAGKCRSKRCSNFFYAWAEKKPGPTEGLQLVVRTKDTSKDKHKVIRHTVRTVKRRYHDDDDAYEDYSIYKRKIMKKRRRSDDSEDESKPMNARKLVRYVEDLMVEPPYIGSIQEIGSYPFFVFYMSSPQLQIYNEYCKQEQKSFINIDTTGTIIESMKRSNNMETGLMFLSSIVTNIDDVTIPVCQMISEIHTPEFIQYWLRTWLRNGAQKPKEIISNYSRTLLSAVCLAFNDQSMSSYVAERFSSLSVVNLKNQQQKSFTYIRIDIEHLVHAVSRWKCFERVNHPRVRNFYIRCICLMIDAETLEEFTKLIFLTTIVAVTDFEDSLVASKISPQAARKKLEASILGDGKLINIPDPNEVVGLDDVESILENPSNDPELATVRKWINGIDKSAKKKTHEGSELNAYYFPEFAERLMDLATEFPLWTRVTIPRDMENVGSSFVEEYFDNLKTRIVTENPSVKNLPVRVDEFLKIHLKELISYEELGDFQFMNEEGNLEIRLGSTSHKAPPPKKSTKKIKTEKVINLNILTNSSSTDPDLEKVENAIITFEQNVCEVNNKQILPVSVIKTENVNEIPVIEVSAYKYQTSQLAQDGLYNSEKITKIETSSSENSTDIRKSMPLINITESEVTDSFSTQFDHSYVD